jgi:hypothetical protein
MNVYHVQNYKTHSGGGAELNLVVTAVSYDRALELAKLQYSDQNPNLWKIVEEIDISKEGTLWISSDYWEH